MDNLLANESNLATLIPRGKHFHNSKPSIACYTKKKFSWFRSGCIQGIKFIMEYTLWDVGNGENIDIWTEPWVPNPKGSVSEFTVPTFFLHQPKSHNLSLKRLCAGILYFSITVSQTSLPVQSPRSTSSLVPLIPPSFGAQPKREPSH